MAAALMFAVTVLLVVGTNRDVGLTWDEPNYTNSQRLQAQWYRDVLHVRSWDDLRLVLSRESLHRHWEAARAGLSTHPPMASHVANLTLAVGQRWLGELYARRLSSALELAFAVALLVWFLGRRYGVGSGIVAGLSLVLMPRVFGHAHINATDMPTMVAWGLLAVAIWEARTSRGWQIAVALCFAIAFMTKIIPVLAIVPAGIIALWEFVTADQATGRERSGSAYTSPLRAAFMVSLALPLVVFGFELMRLAVGMRDAVADPLQPELMQYYLASIDLLNPGVHSRIPGWFLILPAGVWLLRWGAAHWARRSGKQVEFLAPGSPYFEMTAATLAWAPPLCLALHPGWWRDTATLLAHYANLVIDREAYHRPMEIYYFGQTYIDALPWSNGFVLAAITVPLGIIILAAVGSWWAIEQRHSDLLPLYLFLGLLILPVLRTVSSPAHGVVRLMLPTFFFMAALAGIGYFALVAWFQSRTNDSEQAPQARSTLYPKGLTAILLGSAALSMLAVRPYYLAYYNILVGGTSGAWSRGLETTYLFDALNADALNRLNQTLPSDARLGGNASLLEELHKVGHLRPDIKVALSPSSSEYFILIGRSSFSRPFSRLLYGQRPIKVLAQHDGVVLAALYDAQSIARVRALQLLAAIQEQSIDPTTNRMLPALVSPTILEIAEKDPQAIAAGVQMLVDGTAFKTRPTDDTTGRFLDAVLGATPEEQAQAARTVADICRFNPQCLGDAASMLILHRHAVADMVSATGLNPPTPRLNGYLDDFIEPRRR